MWVAGLGPDALAATGFFMPFFFLAMAIATGIGVGGGAVVSRMIGAHDRKAAESASMHTIIFSVAAAAFFSVPFILVSPVIFTAMGATTSLDDAVSYANIMFTGTIFVFFTNVANALLRSEGNARKAMVAMLIGTLLNVGLDPLFIYTFGMGVGGAAIATVISLAISAALLFYWLFVQKKNYLKPSLSGFRFHGKTIREILFIGIPTMIGQGSMSVMMFFLVGLLAAISKTRADAIIAAGGTVDPAVLDHGIAVFTAGWTVVQFAILPLLGIATAVISVTAAAFGAREFSKLKTVHSFSFSIGLGIEVVIALLTFFLAPFIAMAFTWSLETAPLAADIAVFFSVIWLYFPAAAGNIVSQAVFQGLRMAYRGLVTTLLRTVVFALFFAWLFGIYFRMEEPGVYTGMVVATWISSIVAFVWARKSIAFLQKRPDMQAGKIEGPQTVDDTVVG